MGKRKIETLKRIANDKSRQTTFCKRKRGLIKKAIELSMLCDQLIYMVVFDKTKQRLVEYQSHDKFTAKVVERLTDPSLPSSICHEKYQNKDFQLFQIGGKEIEIEEEQSPVSPENEPQNPGSQPSNSDDDGDN